MSLIYVLGGIMIIGNGIFGGGWGLGTHVELSIINMLRLLRL